MSQRRGKAKGDGDTAWRRKAALRRAELLPDFQDTATRAARLVEKTVLAREVAAANLTQALENMAAVTARLEQVQQMQRQDERQLDELRHSVEADLRATADPRCIQAEAWIRAIQASLGLMAEAGAPRQTLSRTVAQLHELRSELDTRLILGVQPVNVERELGQMVGRVLSEIEPILQTDDGAAGTPPAPEDSIKTALRALAAWGELSQHL